jgi:hypothetical protein
MGALDTLNHLVNFGLPALVVALLVAAVARRWFGPVGHRPAFWLCLLVNALAGLLVLCASLWFFGRDGKMLAYAGLVLVVASTQWALSRAWKP